MSQVTPKEAEEPPPPDESPSGLSRFVDENRSLITALSLLTTLAGVSTIVRDGGTGDWVSLYAFTLSIVLWVELLRNGMQFAERRRPGEPSLSLAIFLSIAGALLTMLVFLALERHVRLIGQVLITGPVIALGIYGFDLLLRRARASQLSPLKLFVLIGYVILMTLLANMAYVKGAQLLGIR